MAQNEPQRANGKFAKGNGGGPGRPKGSQDKVNRNIRLAITGAAADLGEDGLGTGGLRGFLKALGRDYPPALGALVGKLLPPSKDEAAKRSGTLNINIVSVPVGQFVVTEADARRLAGLIAEPPMEPERPLLERAPILDQPSADVVALYRRRVDDDDPAA